MKKSTPIYAICTLLLVLICGNNGEGKGEVDVDILNKLKESGALDDIKEELEKMLDKKEASNEDKGQEPKEASDEEKRSLAFDHLRGYKDAKEINLPNKLIKALVDLPTTATNQHVHYATLTHLFDKLDQFINRGKKEGNNNGMVDKFIEVTKQVKTLEEMNQSILNGAESLAELAKEHNKNSEDVKAEMKKTDEDEKKKDEWKNPYQNPLTEGLDVETMIQGVGMFLDVVKTKPDIITKYVCDALEKYDMVSVKTLDLVRTYSKKFAKTKYFTDVIEYIDVSLQTVVKTKGKKIAMSVNMEIQHYKYNAILCGFKIQIFTFTTS